MNDVLREEKKFAINAVDGVVLKSRLGQVMHGDIHNGLQGYTIRSLYFDTPDDNDFNDKVDGLEIRRKIRLRIYDPKSDFAMLEMKQKQGPYQRKRSLRLSREDAEKLCRGDYRPLLGYTDPSPQKSTPLCTGNATGQRQSWNICGRRMWQRKTIYG